MSVYVITGVSKGIGFEFLKQISEDQENLVVGLVRDKAATEKKISTELGNRPNVHILHADLTGYATLKQAAAETTEIVGDRGVDYLVANGALVSSLDAYGPIGALSDKPDQIDAVSQELLQTNVVGNIHLFNLFLPLVLKGKVKKVIALSTGLADLDLTNDVEVDVGALYAASKAALNVIVAKFNAQYKKEGVLFLSISPGLVEVGRYVDATPEELQVLGGFAGKLASYAPDFKGPITPEESVRLVRGVWERASIEGGYGGAFISHLGNKQWV
ncbi:hypothetical protein BJY04DRAFT_232668 [Aspergillus karnatakaensis]|uniref:uncharacterized protein n=1 Tax=Aspergillus karnatakaensis TaxID=1810916 RepID=UPI003CCCBB7E